MHHQQKLVSNPNRALLENVTTNAVIQTARIQEETIEQELLNYDHLLDDDIAIEKLRQKRLDEMKQQAIMKQKWIDNGHGQYTELSLGSNCDIAKEFFQVTKQSSKVIVHFYKSTSARVCDIFHKHLQILAHRHYEAKFMKINVESVQNDSMNSTTNNGITYLVEKLQIRIMPTLVLIKDRQVIHKIQGFDELGGIDTFSTNALAYVLGMHEMIDRNEEEEEKPIELQQETLSRGGNMNAIRFHTASNRTQNSSQNSLRRGLYHDDDD